MILVGFSILIDDHIKAKNGQKPPVMLDVFDPVIIHALIRVTLHALNEVTLQLVGRHSITASMTLCIDQQMVRTRENYSRKNCRHERGQMASRYGGSDQRGVENLAKPLVSNCTSHPHVPYLGSQPI
jgi:hypothetical protein